MKIPATFKVYNASAGSGKTFTLVKEYLAILLSNNDIYTFQNILAITFTNKAAAEMKERVLHNLDQFAQGKETPILIEILKETQLDWSTIKERSAKILDAILQNYSAFAITTIDSFTYKIIKNFAYDLNLPLNFEVELDSKEIVNEAIDVLVSKIGTDQELTNLLIDYTLDKIDDDTSWDISKDLSEVAKVLLNENDIPHFKKLSSKSIKDFVILRAQLIKEKKQIESKFRQVGAEFLQTLEENQLEFKDFHSSTIPKYFNDVKNDGFRGYFRRRSETIEKAINEQKFYTKNTESSVAETIDGLTGYISSQFKKAQSFYNSLSLINNLLKNTTPLAVLNKINNELIYIKEENNIQLNAEFNQLIHEEIKAQPAPFIYERIGQRYQYYFIDEMQDTSVMQWQNLIPLIDNALSQEDSMLFLVGDAKQAIYRWRGGKAEQFIDLSSNSYNPFQVQKEPKNLETNFRSYSEIIDFNNAFFTFLAPYFQNPSFQNIYQIGNQQKKTDKIGGYVNITLFKDEHKEKNTEKYNELVYQKIQQLQPSFDLGEICIIVRKKDQGIALATYLSQKGIDVISSDSLLLQNSEVVQFVVRCLGLIQNPNDKTLFYECLYFIHTHFKLKEDKHQFINRMLYKSLEEAFEEFGRISKLMSYEEIYQRSLYDLSEELVRGFQLIEDSDAYLQCFLDTVLEQQRKGLGLREFLDYWERKKENLSITAQESNDAVQIMTIHKSKGLEFPVVIFPTTIDTYYIKGEKIWLDDLPSQYPFDTFYMDYSAKETKHLNYRAAEIHQEIQESLELDNFNLLYVAFTRAVEQLYIISDYNESKGAINDKRSSGVLIEFLKTQNKWQDDTSSISFGNEERVSKIPERNSTFVLQEQFLSNHWKNNNLVLLASDSKLWDTKQGEAIDFGNLLHEIMQEIYYESDVDQVLESIKRSGSIDQQQFSYLKMSITALVKHPELSPYFSKDNHAIYNERAFFSNNQTIIPDRLVELHTGDYVLIDYKTGAPNESHHQQILQYQEVLESANYYLVKKLLVYINDKIEVVKVS